MSFLQNSMLKFSSVLCVILGFLFVESTIIVTEEDAKDYLEKFGYLEINDGPISNLIFRGSIKKFEEALRKFQLFSSLKTTGELDNNTLTEMNKPRCGVVDLTPSYSTRQNDGPERFSYFGQRWKSNDISYRITKYSKQARSRIIDRDLSRAMQAWTSISPLTFRMSRNPNIELRFESGEHGDGEPLDGRHGVLAHAFPPRDGRVHFDDDDKFLFGNAFSPKDGVNFIYVAVHEIGHALGLAHSDVQGAIMFPSYPSTRRNEIFHEDDKKAINKLYGDPRSPTAD